MDKERKGTDFYRAMGAKGREKFERDFLPDHPDFYSEIGEMGGYALAAKVEGTSYFADLGRRGGKATQARRRAKNS